MTQVQSSTHFAVPGWAWLLSLVLGGIIVSGSLSYQPDGRINLLWVWVIWALLPALGSLVALLLALWGGRRPWLFRWRHHSLSWHPNRRNRWQMLWQLQLWWCLVAMSMVVAYGIFLLFTDLAFGWSSTLISDPATVTRLVQSIAWPWRSFWPAAAPGADIVAATQFARIVPQAGDPALAASWWRFLLASLVVYNLLPRLVLVLAFYGRWRSLTEAPVSLVAPASRAVEAPQRPAAPRDAFAHWVGEPVIAWECTPKEADLSLGLGSWADDQQALTQLLATPPARLCWWVIAERTPVAELADCMARAQAQGVATQGLYVQLSENTDSQRHVASWDAFARQNGLIWLT